MNVFPVSKPILGIQRGLWELLEWRSMQRKRRRFGSTTKNAKELLTEMASLVYTKQTKVGSFWKQLKRSLSTIKSLN